MNVIGQLTKDIGNLTDKFGKYKKGGFGIAEMVGFSLESGAVMVETMESVKGITGAKKKEAVVVAVKKIYRSIDPDIPWIPEPFETVIENLMLDHMVPAFVDILVKILKAKGIFKSAPKKDQ